MQSFLIKVLDRLFQKKLKMEYFTIDLFINGPFNEMKRMRE